MRRRRPARSAFLDIPRVVEGALEAHTRDIIGSPTLSQLLEADLWARDYVEAVARSFP